MLVTSGNHLTCWYSACFACKRKFLLPASFAMKLNAYRVNVKADISIAWHAGQTVVSPVNRIVKPWLRGTAVAHLNSQK